MRSSVLYIDDDHDACEMVSTLLRLYNENLDVKTVENAKNALDMVGDPAFDLYILDYRMPILSGVEICSLIRQSDSHTPIVIYSALTRPADREAALNAGANAYLVKPNDIGILAETVERLLNKRAGIPLGA